MKEIREEIEIASSATRVWQILTDFPSYPYWNPFIRRAKGEAQEGAKLDVYLQPSGARGMGFRPVVLKAEANHEFRWLGHLLLPSIFDGEHIFTIEPTTPGRVRFVQREIFKGLLVPFLAKSLDKDTRRGFKEMNQALKTRAEAAV